MKKRFIILGVILVLVAVFLGLMIWQILDNETGPGYGFRIVGGCEVIKDNCCGPGGADDFNITEQVLDEVIVEYGYGSKGLERATLREYCDEKTDVDRCKKELSGRNQNYCDNLGTFEECIESQRIYLMNDCILGAD